MYRFFFRWFPKSALTRAAGWLASLSLPPWLLVPVIRCYVWCYDIDMSQFAQPPQGYATFNGFFTRAVQPEARPVLADPLLLACPVDGTVTQVGPIRAGQLLQAKGIHYALADLLGGDAGWQRFDGGQCLTLYLHPRDYHRFHTPCAGSVTRFCYVPGEFWTVGPAGVRSVPGLFARNERLITYLRTEFGELALVAVGATVVGRIKVVYHDIQSHLPGATRLALDLSPPVALAKGAELGRFELGSTVILLTQPDQVDLNPFYPGDPVRMGMPIGRVRSRS